MKINHIVRMSVLIPLWLGSAVAQTATSRIVSAANAFLSTLDEKQRQSVQFSFDDEAQRKRWSNFPVAMVPRGGISMGLPVAGRDRHAAAGAVDGGDL